MQDSRVAPRRLDRVARGVAEIQDAAQVRLAFVLHDDSRLLGDTGGYERDQVIGGSGGAGPHGHRGEKIEEIQVEG